MKPPIDQPATFALSSPSASMSEITSSAIVEMSVTPETGGDSPMPRFSGQMTRDRPARASMNLRSQSSLPAAYPLISNSGSPRPTSRNDRRSCDVAGIRRLYGMGL
jgi:hypothetical protein